MNFAALVKAYQVFTIFLKLLPLAQQIVVTLGALFPQGGQGAEKLAQANEWLQEAFDKIEGVKVEYADVWEKLEPWIAKLVAKYNQQGWPAPENPGA